MLIRLGLCLESFDCTIVEAVDGQIPHVALPKMGLLAMHAASRNARHDRIARRLRRLGKMTGLTRIDVEILELLLRYQTQPVIEGMIGPCSA